jgi:thiol-disulfide isomerase/thioredoxin
MRAGGSLSALMLRTTDEKQVHLDSLLKGPSYLVVTSSQCTYCEQEMIALETLNKEYGPYINVIAISLDRDWKELIAYTRAHPARDWTWCFGGDDPQVMDVLRMRSIPSFMLLNDNVIVQAPAPPPSNGLAAVLFKLKAEADERNKLRPDQGPPPRRR